MSIKINGKVRFGPARLQLIWASKLDGSGNSNPVSMTTDSDGNIYVVGNFSLIASQDSFSVTSKGGNDIYIAKYNKNGEIQFLKQIGGSAAEVASTIALSNDDNYFYVSGIFTGTCTFETTVISSSPYAAANQDLFLAKYKNNGDLQWAYNIAYGTETQNVPNIAVDKNDNIIMCGTFLKDITFRGGLGTLISAVPAIRQSHIAKFDQSGNFIWANQIVGDNANTTFRGVRCFNDSYYFSGHFVNNLFLDIGTITSNGALSDMFVYKIDLNGTGQWVRKIQGTGAELVWKSSIDNNGNTFISGYFNSPVLTIDTNATETTTLANQHVGTNELLLVSYDKDGNLNFAKTFGSIGDDLLYNVSANGTSIIITGKYGGTIEFGSFTLTTANTSGDAFFVELDYQGNVKWAQSAKGSLIDIGYACDITNTGAFIFTGNYTSASLVSENTTLTNSYSTTDMFLYKFARI